MKKFEFSLQKILELREFQKKQAEIDLGKANSELQKIKNKLEILAQNLLSMKKEYDSTTDFNYQISLLNYKSMLENEKESLLEEMAKIQLIVDEKKEVLKEAMKKTTVLEKLKEKKFNEWKKEMEKIEELENEDIIGSSYSKSK